MIGLCRDCASLLPDGDEKRCLHCRSPRIRRHAEIENLSVAHIDCDAFYASVEKRDRPELRDRPVIVGGGKRGVASTCCYVARTFGVRSAMPMFQALKICPNAVVIRPDMAKYACVAKDIRERMLHLTPLVEPLSMDEAFLDLTGTERLHKRNPAQSLAALAVEIERDIGITISVGLSYNKFLAKIASELDKPRGFAVIGRAEAKTLLSRHPVTIIPGVGPKMAQALGKAGYVSIADIQSADERDLIRKFGSTGEWIARLARAEDKRRVNPEGERKTLSAETTFERDLNQLEPLGKILWTLSEKVSRRAKAQGCGGRTIALKLKTSDFKPRTRQIRAPHPTQSASVIYDLGLSLLKPELDGSSFRLLGIGLADIAEAEMCDRPDLFLFDNQKIAAEKAMDKVREKFGAGSIVKGRALK
jgi:DNA polymerase-4